jgi:NAD(P)-dependent dehydrogenase (short-subunit alcohol dehydrogenase family)
MVHQQGGEIITVSSELALVGYPHVSAYVASKAGIIGLTKSVALETGPLAINVNAVALDRR